MFAPHGAEHSEFNKRRLSTEQFQDLGILAIAQCDFAPLAIGDCQSGSPQEVG
jgi:hypothetical protein